MQTFLHYRNAYWENMYVWFYWPNSVTSRIAGYLNCQSALAFAQCTDGRGNLACISPLYVMLNFSMAFHLPKETLFDALNSSHFSYLQVREDIVLDIQRITISRILYIIKKWKTKMKSCNCFYIIAF